MNWSELIRELQSTGLTQMEIAARVGTTQPVISDLKRGTIPEPRYTLATKLLALHRKVCGRKVAA